MKLSCRLLTDCNNVNSWHYTNVVEFAEGDTATVYIQLLDESVHSADEGYVPPGRRYVPASGATLSVIMQSLDITRNITRFATQPFPLDGSIWSFNVLPTDGVRGTIDLILILTEGTKITRGTLKAAIAVAAQVQS